MDVIFDIDGTLANASHRLHFIEKNPKDWDAFLSDDQMALDTPIEPILECLKLFLRPTGNRVLFITGRPERQREATLTWLRKYIGDYLSLSSLWIAVARLYMRPDDDRRPSHVVKALSLMQAREDGFNPTLVFEDRKLDAQMWRRNGLVCCQVAEGDY